MAYHKRPHGFSLLEVLIAFLLLLVTVLTLVGYTTTVHRASHEGKRQALASFEARSMLERIRDFPGAFEQAQKPGGLSEVKSEYLLTGETEAEDNEDGRKSAAQFRINGTARLIEGEVYQIVVTVEWDEDKRPRKLVLESRMIPVDR